MTAAPPAIAMVDYGMGNRRSVAKAFEHVGTPIAQTSDPDELRAADGLVVPGVGAFPEAMRRLRALGLDDVVRERARAGVPVIGLCLGMQLLFDRSVEHEGADGLGLLAGQIVKLDPRGLKLPHIGWNSVHWERSSALCDGLPDPAAFYHVHTFVAEPEDPSIVLGRGEYGSPFVLLRRVGQRLRRAVSPREVLQARPRAAAQLRRHLRLGARRAVILYPAIDIAGGRAVRLVQGDFDAETVYADSPLEAARAWMEAGARYLHVIDLDGARTGAPQNLHHLERVVAELGLPVQYGGGLRSVDAVADAIAAGASRAILGTAAFSDVDFLDEVVARFGERIVVSIDTRGGFVSTAGWTETTTLPAAAAIERLQDRGVRTFVFTDVDKDGLLGGPDLDEVRRLAAVVRGRFMYSGGIGRREDLVALAALREVNLTGVIVGKALYERRFTVAEGIAALAGRDADVLAVGGAPRGVALRRGCGRPGSARRAGRGWSGGARGGARGGPWRRGVVGRAVEVLRTRRRASRTVAQATSATPVTSRTVVVGLGVMVAISAGPRRASSSGSVMGSYRQQAHGG